jgi:signal transduction histidine kinase
MEALQAISRHLEAEPSEADCLRRLSRTLADVSGARRCVLFLLDPEGRSLRPQLEAWNVDPALLAGLPPVPCDRDGRDRGGSVVYGDQVFWNSPENRGEHDHCRRLVEAVGARDAMAVAWKAGSDRLGAIAVFDAGSGAFDEEDAWVLQVAGLSAGLIWQQKRAEIELHGLRDREATQLRLEAERMAELEQVKTNFLNMASHELRGPVGVARGYLSMVRDGDFGEIEGQLQAPLEMVGAKVDQIWRLVELMVDASRQEKSRVPLRLEALDLREPVAAAAAEMRPLAEAGHALHLHLPPQPVCVPGDRARLTEVVTSLLDNAVKYSPHGGRIDCRLRMEGERALITVQDQGLGIAAEHRSRIFTRFGRIVTAENSHIQGTGLGLYVARELTRLHRGEITVESESGQGSIFTVTLPSADAVSRRPPC